MRGAIWRSKRQKRAAQRAEVGAILNYVRGWARRANLAEIVPAELQSATGYRTGDTDKAMALGVLSLFAQYGKLDGPISLMQLSEATGRALDTCRKAMRRIAPLFPCTNDAERAPDEARRYRLCDELRRSYTESKGAHCDPFTIYATLPMDTHRAHDAFVRSMTPLSAEGLAARIEARRAAGKEAKATGDERRRVAALIPSAGPAALVVVDAISEFGPLRGVDLRELTHKKKWTISRAVKRLVYLGLAEIDASGAVALAEGWADHLNTITPEMPTYGTGRRRVIARCDAIIDQCERIVETVKEPPKWLHRRLERARKRKADIAAAEGFDGKATRRAVATGNHSLTWWDVQKIKRRDELHAQAQMDIAEKRRGGEWEIVSWLRQMRTEGASKRDAVRWLEYAEYTRSEAWALVHRVWAVVRQQTSEVCA